MAKVSTILKQMTGQQRADSFVLRSPEPERARCDLVLSVLPSCTVVPHGDSSEVRGQFSAKKGGSGDPVPWDFSRVHVRSPAAPRGTGWRAVLGAYLPGFPPPSSWTPEMAPPWGSAPGSPERSASRLWAWFTTGPPEGAAPLGVRSPGPAGGRYSSPTALLPLLAGPGRP